MKSATWDELQVILGGEMLRRAYLWGPPGVGKSRIALDILRKVFPADKVYQTT